MSRDLQEHYSRKPVCPSVLRTAALGIDVLDKLWSVKFLAYPSLTSSQAVLRAAALDTDIPDKLTGVAALGIGEFDKLSSSAVLWRRLSRQTCRVTVRRPHDLSGSAVLGTDLLDKVVTCGTGSPE